MAGWNPKDNEVRLGVILPVFKNSINLFPPNASTMPSITEFGQIILGTYKKEKQTFPKVSRDWP